MVWPKPDKQIDICRQLQISAGIFRYLQADLAACEHWRAISSPPAEASNQISTFPPDRSEVEGIAAGLRARIMSNC